MSGACAPDARHLVEAISFGVYGSLGASRAGWPKACTGLLEDAAGGMGANAMYDSGRHDRASIVGYDDGYARPPTPVGGLSKRVLDLAIAIPALIVLAPLLALTAIIVRLSDGGPALFCQRRVGYNNKKFNCFKFRTMVVDAEARLNALLDRDPVAAAQWRAVRKLEKDPRVTALGRFLRMSSIDELPQLINVLRGEMSLVGPRPVLEDELGRYGASAPFYLSCRPGLTGLWQVSGRSNVDYESRVKLDVNYAANWSLGYDIKIIAMTIPAVLTSRGAI